MSRDFLTEIAYTLDSFFKGLADCGVLTSYSVELQIFQDPETVMKIKILVLHFIKNMQGLYSKIPLFIVKEKRTDDTRVINPPIISKVINGDVVVVCDTGPLNKSSVVVPAEQIGKSIEDKLHTNSYLSKTDNCCNSVSGHAHNYVILCQSKDVGDDVRNSNNSVNERSCKKVITEIQEEKKDALEDTVISASDSVKENSVEQSMTLKNTVYVELKKVDKSSGVDNNVGNATDSSRLALQDSQLPKYNNIKLTESIFHVVIESAEQPKSSDTDLRAKVQRKTLETSSESGKKNNTMQNVKLECSECQLEFTSSEEKKIHSQLFHDNLGSFTCTVCDKLFLTSQDLKKHGSEVHDNKSQCTCDVCGKVFTTKLSLSRHMGIHIGKKNAVCDICKKSFRRTDYLLEHKRIHLGKQSFPCKVCEKKFSRKVQLKVHEKLHSCVKDHICEICSKGFSRRDKLKEHMNRHLNIKRFNCSVCSKSYAENRDLKVHMKVHFDLNKIPTEYNL